MKQKIHKIYLENGLLEVKTKIKYELYSYTLYENGKLTRFVDNVIPSPPNEIIKPNKISQ